MANCDDWFFALTTPCVVTKGVTTVAAPVAQAISFGSDPAGYVAQKLQTGANGLATGILPALKNATEPDLSAQWFISTYKVSFALAILLWSFLLIYNLVQYSRRQVSGDEVLESFTVYSPIFIIGAVFGPMLGQLLVRLSGSLTDGLIAWGVAKSSATTTKGLSVLIGGDPNAMLGGSFVAILIYALMILALLMALVILLIMLVTLLFSGSVFSLGLVWLTKAKDRSKGLKLAQVWAGVLFAQPLLFLMLGAALSMATGSTFGTLTGQNGSPGLKTLVGLLVAAIALIIATTSPAMLLKFAPVGPTDATPGGPGLGKIPTGKKGGSGRGGAGESSDSNGQLAQVAQNNAQRGGDGGGLAQVGAGSGGGAVGAGAGGGAAGAGAGGGAAAGGTAAAGAKAGAAGGPAGMAAGAAVAGAVGKAKEGAEAASKAAGDAAESAASTGDSGGSQDSTGLADVAGQSSAGEDSTGAAADGANGAGGSLPSPSGEPVIPDAAAPEPVGGSLSDVTGASTSGDPGPDSSANSTSAAAGSDGSAGGGRSWPTGDGVAPAQQPGGGFGQMAGQAAALAGGVASYAAKASNTMAVVAQAAAGHAEEQMDHHKDAPRAHR